MSDPLSRATEALKELHAEAPAPPPGTRDLVLERATLGRRERRVSRAILMPLAAAFILLATWAAASGALSRAFSSRTEELEVVPHEPAAPTSSAPRPVATAPATTPEEPATTTAPPPVKAPPSTTVAAALGAAPTSTPVVTVASPSMAATPPSAASTPSSTTPAPAVHEPGDTLYAAAHRAHFDDRDPARALVAWDAYLTDAPQGHFAPEARYNRALCLIRLGRASEATQALQPFADGAYGAYRADEAKKLLAALADAASR